MILVLPPSFYRIPFGRNLTVAQLRFAESYLRFATVLGYNLGRAYKVGRIGRQVRKRQGWNLDATP